MKYNFEGFLIGLGLFWIITFVSYLTKAPIIEHSYYFGFPIIFWIVWSIFGFQGIGEKNE